MSRRSSDLDHPGNTVNVRFWGLSRDCFKQCVPTRQLAKLRAERYEWAQAESEPLTVYIQAIIDAVDVLRLAETEEEMVARIVDGFSPTQKARFVFQNTPVSFPQLEKLNIVFKNATYADWIRGEQIPKVEVRSAQTHYNHRQGRPNHRQLGSSDKVNNRIVCFFCNKPSHVQSHSFKRQGQFRGPGPQ
jgi:hypothetical protein